MRRQGLKFVAELKEDVKNIRLIPFEFNDTHAYILAIGDNYLSFYKNGKLLKVGLDV